ncbi:MAG TPA: hypothetical protein VFK36_08125 [Gemmatimonadales bacterium]|nr:hypothetical protein [Gemmatimonadales bacterium]
MIAIGQRLGGALLLAAAVACGGDAGGQDDGSRSPSSASAPANAARPSFEPARAPDSPCEWLPPAEVEAMLGSFSAPPVRVRPGEDPSPDPYGTGCLYTLAVQPQMGTGTVTLSVSLNDGGTADLVSAASASLMGVASDTGRNRSAAGNSGWDHESRLGTTYLARIGHIGVQVDRGSFEIPDDRTRQLAAAARDKMADRPFANPVDPFLDSLRKARGRPANPPPQGPDPCALLTRAEAEAVLGPLTVPPYRSAGDSPLWDPSGQSCSYFTGNGHRALTIMPTWSQGQMTFKMATGVGGVVASASGVDAGMAADTLDGPWDDVMQDMHGILRFLKGDRMLDVMWVTSSTDRAGALRLAAAAVGRL